MLMLDQSIRVTLHDITALEQILLMFIAKTTVTYKLYSFI
jgi:hypothetical protein